MHTHMNYLLKSNGSVLGFCLAAFLMTPATWAAEVIGLKSQWKYKIGTNEASLPDTAAWRTSAFDDSSWQTGTMPIGYSDAGSAKTGYEAEIQTVIPNTAPGVSLYFRKTFVLSNVTELLGLRVDVYVDDGAVVWINGVEVNRVNVPGGNLAFSASSSAAGEQLTLTEIFSNLGVLVNGTNVIAIHALNSATASSDFFAEATISTMEDTAPIAEPSPPRGATVLALPNINVLFSEGVTGVNASDLLINGVPATGITTNNPNDYFFTFPPPATGQVTVAFAPGHGITDTDGNPTPFAGDSWSYTLNPALGTGAFIISEFCADNDNLRFNNKNVQDEDGDREDWIEIRNPGTADLPLAGWYLTDEVGSNKWRFPTHINTTLGAGRYLIVWASGKDRTNNFARLHTNFRLDPGGEYLALLDPEGNVKSEFGFTYPAFSRPDISYGRDPADPEITGFFESPTPGANNTSSGTNFASEPAFSVDSGVFTNNSITVTITGPVGATIRYTVDGTNPTNNSPVYSGALTLSTNVFIKARVFQNGVFPSKIVSRSYFFLDTTTRDFNSNLPILIISTSGRAVAANIPAGSPRTRGSLAVMDTFRGRSSITGDADYIGLAEFEIFGQTSAGFTKRPYNIEMQDDFGGDKSVSLLGFPADADWKLRNPWSDKCLMNDFLAAELFEQMGNYSTRRRMVEVFVDTTGGKLTYPGDYSGVHCFLEKIEQGDDRVNVEELTPDHTTEPEISGGYVWKKDKPPADGSPEATFSTTGGAGLSAQTFRWHEPKPRDLTLVQSNWIRNHLIRFEQALYATDWLIRTGTNHYSYYADLDSFVDQQWIVEFPKQIDGYRISNYMHKDRNGKIKMAPIWDWNLSFGNANYLEGGFTNGWYWALASEFDHMGWLRRPLTGGSAPTGTAGDPMYIQKLIDRWGVLRTNVMNGDRVVARIDEIATLLSEAAARNYFKYNNLLGVELWPNPNGAFNGNPAPPRAWDVNYVTPNTYAGIIAEMKKWTRGRFNWIDGQFVKAPSFNHGGGQVSPGFNLTMTAAAGTIYYRTDGTDPRLPNGNIAPGTLTYSGGVPVNNNVRVFARARVGTGQYSWSPPTIATLYTTTPALRFTEVMYHPADQVGFSDEDFEFLELRNTGTDLLNLNGYQIRGGIDFVFPNITLTSGQRVLVVKDLFAFSLLYDTNGMIIAGQFSTTSSNTNNLDNTGERLILEGRMGEPIQDFRYDDDWYKITDGLGFSLTIINDALPPSAWTNAANWRPSGALHGTPGAADPGATAFPQVVVSEALTHSDLPVVDTIELQNLSGVTADISNWYLSDDRLDAKKFRIPNGTTIPAGGFVTFSESQFNAGARPFALSSQGDELFLFSAGADGELTGYLYGFSFGAQRNGVTFGRHVTSVGETHFVSQSANTLNAANVTPLVGDLVISEIHYHPFAVFANGAYWNNSEDEFVEVHNRGTSPITLNYPGNTNFLWRLDNAVEFEFAPNTTIPAGGYLLVVNFNPVKKPALLAAFRSKFNVPAATQIVGPYEGDLSNDDETVRLYQPDTPITNVNNVVEAPSVLAEEVSYKDEAPWPAASDGAGFSLQRRTLTQYANDPINWEASSPTPGRAFTPGAPPTISSQPQSTQVIAGNGTSPMSVTASGPGPFRYQWRKNGQLFEGQTNASLTFTPVQLTDAGEYEVIVMNNSSFVVSSPAYLTVIRGVTISQHPLSQTNRQGQTINFSVVASSDNPISYLWRFNGVPIPDANSSTLTVTNIQKENDGFYDVAMTDIAGTVVSLPARLLVLIDPTIIVHPVAQTVPAGSDVTMSVEVTNTATLPIGFRWRRNSGTVMSNNVNSYIDFVTLTNIQGNNTIDVIAYNLSRPSGLQSLRVTVAAMTDSDGDGMPDAWEAQHNLNTNSSADAVLDLDGDTMANLAEFIAGTDPANSNSFLKINAPEGGGPASISFEAISNRSYTVQSADTLNNPSWIHVQNVPARTTNWTATAVDPAARAKRYYRLLTPVQP